ncbi:MAG: hypothetical protein OEM82_16235, partial [Acidobacteriota bacterium]|nr:hypothetical protein [Acidobacteriota bacterium]
TRFWRGPFWLTCPESASPYSCLPVVGRARALIVKQRFEEAISDLKRVVELPLEEVNAHTLYQTYEALSIGYNGINKNEEAVAELVLREFLVLKTNFSDKQTSFFRKQATEKPREVS